MNRSDCGTERAQCAENVRIEDAAGMEHYFAAQFAFAHGGQSSHKIRHGRFGNGDKNDARGKNAPGQFAACGAAANGTHSSTRCRFTARHDRVNPPALFA
jgi:hypothetical protein